mgnify:CR=1 FL=1
MYASSAIREVMTVVRPRAWARAVVKSAGARGGRETRRTSHLAREVCDVGKVFAVLSQLGLVVRFFESGEDVPCVPRLVSGTAGRAGDPHSRAPL